MGEGQCWTCPTVHWINKLQRQFESDKLFVLGYYVHNTPEKECLILTTWVDLYMLIAHGLGTPCNFRNGFNCDVVQRGRMSVTGSRECSQATKRLHQIQAYSSQIYFLSAGNFPAQTPLAYIYMKVWCRLQRNHTLT